MTTSITWVIIISVGVVWFKWDERKFDERESAKTRKFLQEGGWSDADIDYFFEHAEG
ncbi:hypothetical protein AB3K25_06555 [Leuconostoc sp. MS02]|uniref:Uncharacterized protein n=1 Tax=Leuconostoc aquikimchii TaxID=3236804 RepID=A0ABV3S4X7_9LACO